MIERKRAANPEGSRRLKALKVLQGFQFELVLKTLVGTPDKQVGYIVSRE